MTYLDANRWEELILKYLPQLEKFYLIYYVYFDMIMKFQCILG